MTCARPVFGDRVDLDRFADVLQPRGSECRRGHAWMTSTSARDCRTGDELADVCVRGQARRDVHRRSEDVAVSFHDWPVVHADPHTGEVRFLLDRAQEREPDLEPS